MKVDLGRIEAIALSHGHPDHFLGLFELLKLLYRGRDKGIPLFLHPDAFLERRLNIPAIGHPAILPVLDESTLKEAGAVPIKSEKAIPIAGDLIYITGTVERKTAFEKGFLWAEAKIEGNWVTDPFRGDQGLVVKVKGKGLIVISGCAHAGIINTIEHVKELQGRIRSMRSWEAST